MGNDYSGQNSCKDLRTYSSPVCERCNSLNVSLLSSSRRSNSARVLQTRIALFEPVRFSRQHIRSFLSDTTTGKSLRSTGGGSILGIADSESTGVVVEIGVGAGGGVAETVPAIGSSTAAQP